MFDEGYEAVADDAWLMASAHRRSSTMNQEHRPSSMGGSVFGQQIANVRVNVGINPRSQFGPAAGGLIRDVLVDVMSELWGIVRNPHRAAYKSRRDQRFMREPYMDGSPGRRLDS
jgi:hypothetical protein